MFAASSPASMGSFLSGCRRRAAQPAGERELNQRIADGVDVQTIQCDIRGGALVEQTTDSGGRSAAAGPPRAAATVSHAVVVLLAVLLFVVALDAPLSVGAVRLSDLPAQRGGATVMPVRTTLLQPSNLQPTGKQATPVVTTKPPGTKSSTSTVPVVQVRSTSQQPAASGLADRTWTYSEVIACCDPRGSKGVTLRRCADEVSSRSLRSCSG